MTTTQETLRTHTELCNEIYDVMLEENRQLKASGRPPVETLVSRKRALLGRLQPSIEQLRTAATTHRPGTPELRSSIEKAQQTILKALLLDRENEQLLLKSTMQMHRVAPPSRPAKSHLHKVYNIRG
jgi:flagellar biosynthesis/type III secretory pathway chaperone